MRKTQTHREVVTFNLLDLHCWPNKDVDDEFAAFISSFVECEILQVDIVKGWKLRTRQRSLCCLQHQPN